MKTLPPTISHSILLATIALLLGASPLAAQQSFQDWLKKDRDQRKQFTKTGNVKPDVDSIEAPMADVPQVPDVQPDVPAPTPPPQPDIPAPPPPHQPDAEVTPPPQQDTPPPETHQAKAEWLIMVYAAADNILDNGIVDDIKEMQTIGSSEAIKMVALLDRSEEGEGWSDTRRFEVLNPDDIGGKNSWDTSLSTCTEMGELNMGNPTNLSDFVKWAQDTYPAERSMLVFNNHGGGWRDHFSRAVNASTRGPMQSKTFGLASLSRAICWDDTDDNDFLESREIRTALERCGPLTIIGCDACQMAMIEVAYEWHNVAGYLVTSELFEPYDGWPYDTIMKALDANPAMTTEAFVGEITQLYGASYTNEDTITTQSGIDLTKVVPLVAAVDSVAKNLSDHVDANQSLPATFKERFSTATFRGNNFLDLDAMMESIVNSPGFGEDLVDAAKLARDRFRKAVVANHSTLPRFRGLSIHAGFTVESDDYTADIIRFAADTQWDECLLKLRPLYKPPKEGE